MQKRYGTPSGDGNDCAIPANVQEPRSVDDGSGNSDSQISDFAEEVAEVLDGMLMIFKGLRANRGAQLTAKEAQAIDVMEKSIQDFLWQRTCTSRSAGAHQSHIWILNRLYPFINS